MGSSETHQRHQNHPLPYSFPPSFLPIQNSIQQDDGNSGRASWRTCLAIILDSILVHTLSVFLLLLDLIFTIVDLSTSLNPQRTNHGGVKVCRWGGIAILSILLVKSVAFMIALGLTFFHHPGLVVDGIVVAVALLLELLLENGGQGAGLLVVVSLWRVLRLIESAYEISNQKIESEIQAIKAQLKSLRQENYQLKSSLSAIPQTCVA